MKRFTRKYRRNSKGQFMSRESDYFKALVAIIFLSMLISWSIGQAKAWNAYIDSQDIFGSNFASPVPTDEIYGVQNFNDALIDVTTPQVGQPEDYIDEEAEAFIRAELADTASSSAKPEYLTWEGEASWYSWEGCIGCNENRIMANGEQLDDTRFTLAMTPEEVSKYKLINDMVEVCNTDNGKCVTAKVTDTGGFEKYNRVADLSVATTQEIECSNCIVRITKKI